MSALFGVVVVVHARMIHAVWCVWVRTTVWIWGTRQVVGMTFAVVGTSPAVDSAGAVVWMLMVSVLPVSAVEVRDVKVVFTAKLSDTGRKGRQISRITCVSVCRRRVAVVHGQENHEDGDDLHISKVSTKL